MVKPKEIIVDLQESSISLTEQQLASRIAQQAEVKRREKIRRSEVTELHKDMSSLYNVLRKHTHEGEWRGRRHCDLSLGTISTMPKELTPYLGPLIRLYPNQSLDMRVISEGGTKILALSIGGRLGPERGIGIQVTVQDNWLHTEQNVHVNSFDVHDMLTVQADKKVRDQLLTNLQGGVDSRIATARQFVDFAIRETTRALKDRTKVIVSGK